MRQLLSTGARVPPIAVFKTHWVQTKQESPCRSAVQKPISEKDSDLGSTLTTALAKVDNENISELIGLPPSCELFPEINLSLPDFDDIDTVVLTDGTFEDSFSIDNLSSHMDSNNENVPPPVHEEICLTSSSPVERDSPMQVSSGSDSELCSSSASSIQLPVLNSPGTSTIQSLLTHPPAIHTTVSEPKAESQMEDGLGIPGIPLTALALADDEAAPASQMILQKLDEQDQVQSMSEMSSNEEDEEQEVEKPVRRRKWTTTRNSKTTKKERHMSSTSSDQELWDFDDNDSEVR